MHNTTFNMKRNKSLDGLKYMLIMLVIIGHFIEPSRYNNNISGYLYSFIYSFHMPLFIFMNGYFYKHRTLSEEIKKCLPLLEICIISHLLFIYLSSGNISIRKLVNFGYDPSWYLLSLIYWRLMSSYFFEKFNIKKTIYFSIILEIVTFVIIPHYGGFFSIMRTFQFFPFFIIGYAFKGKLNNIGRYNKLIISLGILSLSYIIYTSSRLQHQCLFQRDGLLQFTEYTDHSLLWVFLFRYSIIICSIFICALILVLACNYKVIQKVSNWGQKTLFIYFGQTLLYPFANKYCDTLFSSLIASVLTIIILTYISQKHISRWIMNPITMYIANK